MNKLREKGRDKGKKPANTADHPRSFMRSAVLTETVLYGIEGNGEPLDYLMLPGHYAAITDYCD